MTLASLLILALEQGASDLHLSAGLVPMLRIEGLLTKINCSVLSDKEVLSLLAEVMDEQQQQAYCIQKEIDFSFEFVELGRFRVNAFRQSRGAAAVFRLIPPTIPSLNDLGLAWLSKELAAYTQGLILVTGPSGSGKTTTLSAVLDYFNRTHQLHILTLEDPIEYVHLPKNCLINQREVHRDTTSFQTALRSALREDPDVIFIGELRDQETIRLAMTAAETGHLVLSTMHTNSANKTINRIVDAFSGAEKASIRSLLSESLQAVLAQHLVQKQGGGRILAFEFMRSNAAIRNLIREDKIAQIYSLLQTGQSQGMQTLDQHLLQLVERNLIRPESAREVALNKTLFP